LRQRPRRLGGNDLLGFWKPREEPAGIVRHDLPPCRCNQFVLFMPLREAKRVVWNFRGKRTRIRRNESNQKGFCFLAPFFGSKAAHFRETVVAPSTLNILFSIAIQLFFSFSLGIREIYCLVLFK
jgi:hypothetical protein